jgi:hypothetical protein
MKETDTPAAGNGELEKAAAAAQPVDQAVGPKIEMHPNETYVLMPARTLSDVAKILRALPYEDVELVMIELKKVQPVHAKPPG